MTTQTITWDEFIKIIKDENHVSKFIQSTSYVERLRTANDILEKDGKMMYDYGCIIDKKFNESIPINEDHFVIVRQVWDERDTGRTEEIEGMGGHYYTEPVMEKLDTFNLVPINVYIYKLSKF